MGGSLPRPARPLIDWTGIRVALKDLRTSTRLRPATFAEHAGIYRLTVQRVEDLAGRPDYIVELGTIDAWLAASSGEQLSEFFARLERGSREIDIRAHALAILRALDG